MKIISLRNNQIEYFKGFDPFELLERGEVKPAIRLGAVYEGSEGDIPAGILLGTRQENALVIQWLFISGPFRRRGFAENLLSVIFRYAKKIGIDEVTSVFPVEYGRNFVCGRENGRTFFAGHGFALHQKGFMTAAVSDHEKLTEYSGPSLEDEGLALYDLFGDILPEEYAHEEESDGPASFPDVIHKAWETREYKLRRFADLPSLKSFIPRHLNYETKERITYGHIGELSLMEFKDTIGICVRSGHTGFIENLADTPPDYFDMKTSSFVRKDGKTAGLLLVHYEPEENRIYAELLYVFCNDHMKVMMGLLRFGILATLKAYPLDTRVMLPYDDKLHKPLIQMLFNDKPPAVR